MGGAGGAEPPKALAANLKLSISEGGQGFNQMPVAPQMPTIPKAVLAFSADGSQAYLYAQAPLWLARHILV